ncbi:MAG: YggT family protein [Clostridia bacterium]|nr:YggT family protein [Clostridia bacterium]
MTPISLYLVAVSRMLSGVASIVYVMLGIVWALISVRVIMTWIPSLRTSAIFDAVERLVFPIILPMKLLLSKFKLFRNTPVDFSSFFTMILISVLQVILKVWM